MDEKKENKKGVKKAAGAVAAWVKGHKVVAVIILALLLALIGLLIFRHVKSSEKKTTAETETVTVERRDLVQSLTLSGTVESGAAYSVSSPLMDVEVKQVNVKVGDTVQKGDVIAVLDDSELRENVSSAQKSLSSAEKKNSQDISNAKRSLRNAEEDEEVQTGKTSKDVKTATSQYNKAVKELNSLKSKLTSAKSELNNAKVNKDRAENNAAADHKTIDEYQKKIDECAAEIAKNEKEINSGVAPDGTAHPEETEKELREKNTELWAELHQNENNITSYKSQPQVAQRLKTESEAQAAYNSAQSSVSSLEETIAETKKKVAALKDAKEKAVQTNEETRRTTSRTVEEQENALSNAYDSASDSLEAPNKELRKAQKDLAASQVVAEANGIVTAVNVKPGDKYKGDAIAVVQDDSSYRVSASADQYDVSSLAVGQNAEITITAADMTDTEGKLIYVGSTPMVSETGAVSTSGSSSSAGSSGGSGANYRVETVIQEPSKNMRIGMTAKVVVTVWKKNNVLAVPDEAIRTNENGENYIVVVNDRGKKRNIDVKYGMKTDYYSEIIGDDVEEGMKVVVPQFGEDGEELDGDTEDISTEDSEE
ncbi:MAG: biotin/lipoyl-binding protein [Mogibacterium sp.]|nr:biotin/lipoyl-binding protein [Mogibacterium sp.]